MCELLALSANTPTDMTFSFRGLARRGGATVSYTHLTLPTKRIV